MVGRKNTTAFTLSLRYRINHEIMRNFLFLLSLLASTAMQAQYCPLVEEDKNWFFKMVYGESGSAIHGAYMLNIKGDTLINNKTYKKLNRYDLGGEHNCQFPPCFSPFIPYEISPPALYAFLREDTIEQKVFCIPAYPEEEVVEEFLLFDFNQMQGDSLPTFLGDFFMGYDSYYEIELGVVDSVTSEFLLEKDRKVINSTGWVPTNGLGFVSQIKLIEGIGLEGIGFFPNNQEFMFEVCIGDYNDCNIILPNLEIYDIAKFNISPNPTSDLLNVESSKTIHSILLYDFAGRKMAMYTEHEIDLSSFSNGFYFIKVLFKDKSIRTMKVVKN